MRELPVSEDAAGQRLDRFLAEALSLSRARVRRLLEEGGIRLGDRALGLSDKGLSVSAGSVLQVEGALDPRDEVPAAEPELPLRVLAEGPGWLAIDKPAGQAVHPLRRDERGSVLNAVVARHPEIVGVGEGGLRSGVVHRLDVETSGALLLAYTEACWQPLRAAFREHRVRKRYRALVHGGLERRIVQHVRLEMASHRPARVRVSSERHGLNAEQEIRPLEALRGATLVEVRPKTGFLHQIRVTLAALGHPVIGDKVYAGEAGAAAGPSAERHMLHASMVAWEGIRADAPDPPDFAALLEALRGG